MSSGDSIAPVVRTDNIVLIDLSGCTPSEQEYYIPRGQRLVCYFTTQKADINVR